MLRSLADDFDGHDAEPGYPSASPFSSDPSKPGGTLN